MLTLLAIVLAQTQLPQPRLFLQPNLRQPNASTLTGSPYLFALTPPASACACEAYPGLAFTGGAAYCTKHNEWVDIGVGDMVECADDIPRWMPGGDGTGGVGLSVWRATNNGIKHSQDFSHGDWSTDNNIIPAPAVTANACLAPDGTMTADLIHFEAATNSLRYSALYQRNCSVTYNVRTLYARTAQADGGTWGADGGTITGHFILDDGQIFLGPDCNHTSDSWTRCRQFDVDSGQIGDWFYFGVNGSRGVIPEQYVCVWQADCAANTAQALNPWPPPVKTVATVVSRAEDIATMSLLFPQWSNYVESARFLDENGLDTTTGTLIDLGTGTPGTGYQLNRLGSKVECNFCSATACSGQAESVASFSNDSETLSCSYDGDSTVFACVNGGGCGDAGVDAGTGPMTAVTWGSQWNGFNYILQANGILKDLSIAESARKDIYLFGDSIVEGNTAGNGFQPQYIVHRIKGNNVSILNEGVSGYTSAQCKTKLFQRLNYVVDAGMQGRSYFMLQCGHNGASDAGGTIADLELSIATAQDAGVHMLWSTIIPDQGDTADILAVNSALTTFANGRGILVADTYTAMEYPPGSGHLNPAYDYGDTVHPNDAGVYVETTIWIQTGSW